MSIWSMIDRLLEGMDEAELERTADSLAGQMDPLVFAEAMAKVPPSEVERIMNAPVKDYSQVQVKPYPVGSPYQNQLAPLKQPLEVQIPGSGGGGGGAPEAQAAGGDLAMALQAYGAMPQPKYPTPLPPPAGVRAGAASPANTVIPELYRQNAQGTAKIPSLQALLAGG